MKWTIPTLLLTTLLLILNSCQAPVLENEGDPPETAILTLGSPARLLQNFIRYGLPAACDQHKSVNRDTARFAMQTAFRMNGPGAAPSDRARGREMAQAFFSLVNGNLPSTYLNRQFIVGLSAMGNDPKRLVGHIARYDSSQDNYAIVSLTPFIRGERKIVNEAVENGLLFKDYLKKDYNLNGSYLIGGFKATDSTIVEINLIDITKSIVYDTLIDVERVRQLVTNTEGVEELYFIRSAMHTIAKGDTYNASKFNKRINSVFVTIAGDVYRAKGGSSIENITSLDLVPLRDVVF